MTQLLLVLCIVLSALLTVSHCTKFESDDVIVKDGHRVVVVEYDGDGKTNTRVLISPPRKGQEEGDEVEEDRESSHHVSPRELIRDAMDKCKNKMANALGSVNDRTSRETGHEPHDARAAREEEDKVTGKAQEAAINKAHRAQNVWEKAKMRARRVGTVVAEELKLTKIGSVVGLIGIAGAYGMCVWVTFVSSYLLASVLGRQQFRVVQSKMYPVYFKAISVAILVALLGHIISRRRKVITDAVEMWQAVNLLFSILMVEANASFVEPRATKAMFETIRFEKEGGRGLDTLEIQSSEAVARTSHKKVLEKRMTKLRKRLSKLNSYTSRLNLLTFMSLTWHFVYLGHRLSLAC